ncbi:MAG TPA: DEAD/DEAH box helicase [Vicinamibacterales bacterium]|nr:DEAD/DEAH box helicase [Vicinamibacterales bacterium]
MPFTQLHLHPDLLKGIRDLGFTRPTPIQSEAIPPAMSGRDLLACAQTGSGKTAAFLLPILHQLLSAPRRTTRALILTPTRELAAQILEDFNGLAVHTPVTGAAIFGGVSMGPQEHAFRSGVDVMVATPGRLLDHATRPYAKLAGIEYLVLDEADRMLDMGFLPDIKRILRHIPQKRQTLFFSATMPTEIGRLAADLLKNPATIALQRQAAPAAGITQAAYPVPQPLKATLLVELLKRGLMTQALAGFKSGRYKVLVATDIAARGIDVEALSHVINFDVPAAPEDYIHRVGRTGRADLTGEAFTFVAPDEESDLHAIERAVHKTLPRVTLPDFDYKASAPQLEVPLAQRIAEIRKRKALERERAKANAARRGGGHAAGAHAPSRPAGHARPHSGGAGRPGGPSSGRFRPRRGGTSR